MTKKGKNNCAGKKKVSEYPLEYLWKGGSKRHYDYQRGVVLSFVFLIWLVLYRGNFVHDSSSAGIEGVSFHFKNCADGTRA